MKNRSLGIRESAIIPQIQCLGSRELIAATYRGSHTCVLELLKQGSGGNATHRGRVAAIVQARNYTPQKHKKPLLRLFVGLKRRVSLSAIRITWIREQA